MGRGHGKRHRVLEPDPAAHWRKERGTGVWRLCPMHCRPRPLGNRRHRKLLWKFRYHWPESQWRNNPKRKKKDFPPGPPPGEGADSPTPEEQDPVSRVRPSQERRLPWHFTGLAGAERPACTFLLPAAGQSSPTRRRRGLPGRSGSPGSGACRTHSYLSGPAIGGVPGPPEWTSSDRGTALWLSLPKGQGPSLCAVPASNLGQNCPHTAASTPWPGRFAGGPWRAGQRRPVQQLCKPRPLKRTRTHEPWTPIATPPSRAVRTEEALALFRAENGALQELVTSSCTSGKNETWGDCRWSACAPRNQSSSLEHLGEGGGLQCSPTLSAARESIAVSPGSDSGNATLPDGGSAAESSSPEPSSPYDVAIDILSSAGAPDKMLGLALSEDTASSSRNTRWCNALEEWEACRDALDGEALTVILKSPWPWAEVALREPEELERGMARVFFFFFGYPPVCRGGIWSAASRWSCFRNENMTHPRALTHWLRSEKLMCVCTRSPFIPALRGGVRVAKHARQLSLACFVNTRRWLGSRARSH